MKFLLIGTGSIGRRHLANLRTLGHEDIICYRSGMGRQGPRPDLGVPSFANLDEALSTRPDVAIVANPTSLHVQTALRCVEEDCHVLIEKPLSHNRDGIQRLVDTIGKRELRAMVAYHMRFHPAIRETKKLLAENVVGRILSVRTWCGQYLPDWHPNEPYSNGYMTKRELGGGVVLTLSHELDYLSWFFGPIHSVSAMLSQPSSLQMETESLAHILVRFRSGTTGSVELDCLRRHVSRGFEILGETGEITGNLVEHELSVRRSGSATVVSNFGSDSSGDPYVEEIRHFVDCIRHGTTPLVSLDQALHIVQVCEALFHSSKSGRHIRV